MKLAIVADIHGNVLALEAVLADLEREAPDAVVNLGDCVSGPLWPEETASLLRDLGWPTVRGNHDRVVASGNVPATNRTDSFTCERLSPESLSWISALEPVIQLTDEILLCHGTPDSDLAHLTETISGGRLTLAREDVIADRLKGVSAPLVCAGHTHIPRLVTLAGKRQTVLNPGSAGLPGYHDDTPVPHVSEAGTPHARYAIAERLAEGWRFDLRAVTYDWDRAAAEALKNGRPDWAKPLATGFCS
ncbi:metallophosphoesterase family protein [Roseibium litorale]|uniref:Metallophosphoesterase family protein n=1 Tax=Roseibium litorale TaxID=2803841 RepID=A0ABR9CHN5_9HYPH|nr:metallophosphoesterase family protein [Roseibium litorale]MBD8890340.1 metallophosphoesterase family protein [Roseibium litorale]